MKLVLLILLLLPAVSRANMLMQYALNYSSETDGTSNDDYEKTRTFNKIFVGASIDGKKRLFFGWNINSWSSSLTKVSDEETYKMLEMGPRLLYFFNEDYRFYIAAEWNPYAKGDRDKTAISSEVSGSSMGFSAGYRFRVSRMVGLGASLNYHTLTLKEEKIGSNEDDISDKITNIMPMLEITIITR